MILTWVNGICEGVEAFVTGMRTTAAFFIENVRGRGGATAVTQQYPQHPAVQVGDRVRGHLINDAPRCIVCHLCDKACPVDCFVMDMERTGDNKPRASRFDIDLSKCIYCGLCVRACPTDSLSMTADFEVDPHHGDIGRYLFRRNSGQLDKRLDTPDVVKLHRLANSDRATLSAEERAWLDGVIDPTGQHLIGMFGMGYYTPEEKAKADAEREEKKKAAAAKIAADKAAKAKAAAEKPAADKPAAGDKPAAAKPADAAEKPAADKPAAPQPPPAGGAAP